MDSPSQQLASTILARLIEEKLVSLPDNSKFLLKFEQGNLTPEDWRLAITMAVSKENQA